MRLNIANPKNGLQKMFDVENENILRIFYDKSISSVLNVSDLGDEWKNWILKINGGQDKEGFPMKQGIITNNRVRLLLPKGSIGCKGMKMKAGEKKRKSIRGSIVSPEISVLNLIVIKEGSSIDGLSRKDFVKKKILPKRASKIRKIFHLNKGDDLRKFITQNKNIYQNKSKKFPKIQRLITPLSIQKKRSKISFKKERKEKSKIELADHGKFLFR